MKKVLLIQNRLTIYNIPIYKRLAKDFDLTCVYTIGDIQLADEFKVIKLTTTKIGPIYRHDKSLRKLSNDFDVVISDMSYKWISILMLFLRKRRSFKLIGWGIGVAASYNVGYDSKKGLSTMLLETMIKRADTCIFYSDYPIDKYKRIGFRNDFFVAHNTVQVKTITYSAAKREQLLFIGSLYKEKGVYGLIEQYNSAYIANRDILNLWIIGEGEESESIHRYIIENGLEKKIKLFGSIYDEGRLAEIFQQSIMCISPLQAGLSVQKSMGYGTPFVTTKHAITGGEIFDIANNVNGLILSSINDLKDVILDVSLNKQKYLKMGESAFDYYNQNCTIDLMYSGFTDAIAYVLEGEKNDG